MDDATIFGAIVIGAFLLTGYLGYYLRGQSVDYEIQEAVKQCELEKEKLQEENQNIKQDMAELLIEYYGKPLVWDVFGITKYKRSLCALKILVKEDIPVINELPC
jgi:hypothetical protein